MLARTPRRLLRPVRPSAALTAAYRRRLEAQVEQMHASVLYWLRVQWRKHPPRLAADASPADTLQRSVKRLARRWNKNWREAADTSAEFFAQRAATRSTEALRRELREAGLAVPFRMTAAMRDVVDATVHANVGLIKSIPARYLQEVEGIVMRGVQAGRDLASVTNEIEKQFGVARRRAALIARDQNNKATASFNRVRQLEVGITRARWVHSAGGHEPRPSHVKAGRDRVEFDVSKGWYDPHEKRHIQPGELINCRCISRPVLEGFL